MKNDCVTPRKPGHGCLIQWILSAGVALLSLALAAAPVGAQTLLSPVGASKFKSFRIPTNNSQPEGITLGPDGNMWFAEAAANQIGRIDPKGKITEFVVPQSGSAPTDIVAGADGALWFTEASGFPEGIGRVTTSGVFTGFAPKCAGGQPCVVGGIPVNSLTPTGIAATPDGLIWFTDRGFNSIVKLDPATGIMTFFVIPSTGSPPTAGQPTAITLGPDGALWFCEGLTEMIGSMTEAGLFTLFGPVTGPNDPINITTGPDGNLWFVNKFDNIIGRVTPSGGITEFTVPTANAQPQAITAGPDGNLYFTETNIDMIVQITPSGVFTDVQAIKPAGGPPAMPFGIAGDAARNLWITENRDNKISRLPIP